MLTNGLHYLYVIRDKYTKFLDRKKTPLTFDKVVFPFLALKLKISQS